jgi:hypothetical protein
MSRKLKVKTRFARVGEDITTPPMQANQRGERIVVQGAGGDGARGLAVPA